MQTILLEKKKFEITLLRLCHQLIENHDDFSNTVLIGLQPRGVFLARHLHNKLKEILGNDEIKLGSLDITFYRDDFRRRDIPLVPQHNDIEFIIENRKVVLIDDVLFTGRSVRAALDALLDYGRPGKVEFLVLIDRRYSRHLPIEPDYVGLSVDTRSSQKVKVEWDEAEGTNKATLIDLEE